MRLMGTVAALGTALWYLAVYAALTLTISLPVLANYFVRGAETVRPQPFVYRCTAVYSRFVIRSR